MFEQSVGRLLAVYRSLAFERRIRARSEETEVNDAPADAAFGVHGRFGSPAMSSNDRDNQHSAEFRSASIQERRAATSEKESPRRKTPGVGRIEQPKKANRSATEELHLLQERASKSLQSLQALRQSHERQGAPP